MTDLRIGPKGRDDDVTRALRELYAAPADPAYWGGLEARIMARIDREGDAWWHSYREWVGRGLIAATIAMLFAGWALARTRTAEARVAYQAIVETPRTPAQQLATPSGDLSDREATLRY